jgi:hypothetical protein
MEASPITEGMNENRSEIKGCMSGNIHVLKMPGGDVGVGITSADLRNNPRDH